MAMEFNLALYLQELEVLMNCTTVLFQDIAENGRNELTLQDLYQVLGNFILSNILFLA